MNIAELRQEIHKVVDNVPDTMLTSVLSLLTEIQSTDLKQVQIYSDLKKILEEDKDLLEKLAR